MAGGDAVLLLLAEDVGDSEQTGEGEDDDDEGEDNEEDEDDDDDVVVVVAVDVLVVVVVVLEDDEVVDIVVSVRPRVLRHCENWSLCTISQAFLMRGIKVDW